MVLILNEKDVIIDDHGPESTKYFPHTREIIEALKFANVCVVAFDDDFVIIKNKYSSLRGKMSNCNFKGFIAWATNQEFIKDRYSEDI